VVLGSKEEQAVYWAIAIVTVASLRVDVRGRERMRVAQSQAAEAGLLTDLEWTVVGGYTFRMLGGVALRSPHRD
jgi:hypothetical protein